MGAIRIYASGVTHTGSTSYEIKKDQNRCYLIRKRSLVHFDLTPIRRRQVKAHEVWAVMNPNGTIDYLNKKLSHFVHIDGFSDVQRW